MTTTPPCTPINQVWHQIGKGLAVFGIVLNSVGVAMPDPVTSKILTAVGTGLLAASVYIAQNPD